MKKILIIIFKREGSQKRRQKVAKTNPKWMQDRSEKRHTRKCRTAKVLYYVEKMKVNST